MALSLAQFCQGTEVLDLFLKKTSVPLNVRETGSSFTHHTDKQCRSFGVCGEAYLQVLVAAPFKLWQFVLVHPHVH